MRKLILALFLITSFVPAFCQISSVEVKPDTISIRFTAIEEANVKLGKNWEATQYTPLKEPMSIKFNGKRLSMVYRSGKKFWETDILEVQKKEKREYGRLGNEFYILKYQENNFIKYVIIEISYLIPGTMFQVKIPHFYYTGEVTSYTYLSN